MPLCFLHDLKRGCPLLSVDISVKLRDRRFKTFCTHHEYANTYIALKTSVLLDA